MISSQRAVMAAALMLLPAGTDAASPELQGLKLQYERFFAEKVDNDYQATLQKLNDSYLQGLKRSSEKARSQGDLQTVLAMEEESNRLANKGELPALQNPPSEIVRLREIYDAELAKIKSVRAASLAALIQPYAQKLKELETSLTKANRIQDAKEVMAYRTAFLESPGEPSTTSDTRPVTASGGKDSLNTLGMKFVPVPGSNILMCVHETRMKDYAAFAAETADLDSSWRSPALEGVPVANEENHPVVNVSWHEAEAFCAWLSKKEGKRYRLPKDREWSLAAGIAKQEREGASPDVLHFKVRQVYPWAGATLPPPRKAGNYGDESAAKLFPSMKVLAGYNDGYPTTAPVMSFEPNDLGIYDLGGNVWEWCEEWFNQESSPGKVLRGGCWFNLEEGGLLSSYRSRRSPNEHSPLRGFRCVVEVQE